MPSFNSVQLIGNITRPIEIKFTPKGTAVAEIGLAVNRNYTTDSGEKREEVTFVDVTVWGKTAEIAGEYAKKGQPIFISGRLALDVWDDKQTGQKRSKLKVVGDNIQLLGSREANSEQQEGPQRRVAQRPPQTRKPTQDPDLDAPNDPEPW